MDGIAVPNEQVIPIETISAGLTGLRIAFVNVFGVTHPDGTWTLIDAGVPGSAPLIRSWAEKQFGKPPAALVLTHGHFDHVGAAKTLADGWDISVYAHSLEFPYLTGEQSYPSTSVIGFVLCRPAPRVRSPSCLAGAYFIHPGTRQGMCLFSGRATAH